MRSSGVPLVGAGREECSSEISVLLLQPFKRDLVGDAVRFGIHPVAPPAELQVHVGQRRERAAQEKVTLHKSDGVLDFPLGLGAVGSAYPRNEPEMGEEVLELRISLVVASADGPLEDHRFDVVIEELLGIPAEVVECMEMALNEGVDVGGKGEDHEAHPGISEDDAEAVHGLLVSVDVQIPAFPPVDLCLDAGFRFKPDDG